MEQQHQGCHPCAHCWQIPVCLPGRKAKGTAGHWPHSYTAGEGVNPYGKVQAVPVKLHPGIHHLPCASWIPSCPFPHLGAGSALLLSFCSRPAEPGSLCRALGQEQLTPAEPRCRNPSGAKDLLAHHGKRQSLCKGGTVHGAKCNWSSSVAQDPPWKGDPSAQRSSVLPLGAPFPASTLYPFPPAPGTSYPLGH